MLFSFVLLKSLMILRGQFRDPKATVFFLPHNDVITINKLCLTGNAYDLCSNDLLDIVLSSILLEFTCMHKHVLDSY